MPIQILKFDTKYKIFKPKIASELSLKKDKFDELGYYHRRLLPFYAFNPEFRQLKLVVGVKLKKL